ncbi:hypothetical protein [Falsibacillus pallidus]|uniref:hypothetical protein n=1 Tax=Falsibacillus pallidus TaxID=493781 RepID=UPI003D98CF23
MLVDINLIEKKKHPYKKIIFISIFVLLFLLAALLLSTYYHGLLAKKESLQQQVNYERQLRTVQNANVKGQDTESVAKLKSAIQWGEAYPISTVSLIKEITGRLPERGYILTFSYSGQDQVSLSVQFDSAPETAYYLKNLKDSLFVKKAELSSIVTENVDETDQSLPRYIAQYNVQIDSDAIRNSTAAKEGEADEN